MRLLVLGGSNSILRGGYFNTLIEVLREIHYLPLTDVVNLAVGANSTVHGLEIAKRRTDLNTFDIILLEYVVNDGPLVANSGYDVWFAAYEGLIRYLLSVRPDVQIFSLIFGHQSPADPDGEFLVGNGIRDISNSYATHVIEVDRYLKTTVVDNVNISDLYADGAHYKRRLVTSLVGNYVANCMVAKLNEERRALAKMPPRLCEWAFEGAELVSLLNCFGSVGAETRIFANSRYSESAIRLENGEEYSIFTSGALILITYVAAPDSGSLLIEEDGEPPVILHTLHERVLSRERAFLLKSVVFTRKPWRDGIRQSTPRKISFRALNQLEYRDYEDAPQYPDLHMIPPPTGIENTYVYLSTALIFAP